MEFVCALRNISKPLIIAANNWNKTSGVIEIIKKHIPISTKKMIVFCKNVEHLLEMKETVINWFYQAGFKV